MLKNLLVLPDGREVFSGTAGQCAIKSVTLTESVNKGNDLTVGSVCACLMEAELITPDGALPLSAGDEVTLYKVDENGFRQLAGIFILEKPTRKSKNRLKLTGYDRVSLLDRDMTQFLSRLTAWPYTLSDLASLICAHCGLELAGNEIPNGDYEVQAFTAEGVTGREILGWIGQIAASFVRATPDGKIEFAWYAPAEVSLAPAQGGEMEALYNAPDLSLCDITAKTRYDNRGGLSLAANTNATDDGAGNVTLQAENAPELYYFRDSLHYESYAVCPTEKVQLRQNRDDIGTVYPDVEGANTYIVQANPLIAALSAEHLMPVAQTLYARLHKITYTPCSVKIPAGSGIRAGSTVRITDTNGAQFTAYIMTRTHEGQADTLECTGAYRRDTSEAVHEKKYEALWGKVLNLRTDVDGIFVENRDMADNLTSLSFGLDGIETRTKKQEQTAQVLTENITALQQSATEISATVKSMRDDGVERVRNTFGLTIDGSAVVIHRTYSQMTNSLTEQGMYVIRDKDKSNETVMLQADAQGVNAENLRVRKHLNVGDHARFENYEGGTGCFFIE